jgi:hypothetical protein
MVDGLERVGLVERRPDATDRRAKLVAITKAGQNCLGLANATRERLLKQIFGALSEEDRATFLRLLDAMDAATKPLTRPEADPAPAGDPATVTATDPAEPSPAVVTA